MLLGYATPQRVASRGAIHPFPSPFSDIEYFPCVGPTMDVHIKICRQEWSEDRGSCTHFALHPLKWLPLSAPQFGQHVDLGRAVGALFGSFAPSSMAERHCATLDRGPGLEPETCGLGRGFRRPSVFRCSTTELPPLSRMIITRARLRCSRFACASISASKGFGILSDMRDVSHMNTLYYGFLAASA